MATQPLSDDALTDTTGFTDNSDTKPSETPADKGVTNDDTLDLTDDQALDDSLAQQDDGDAGEGDKGGEKQENPVEKRIRGALKARDDARNALENEKAARVELERRLAAIETRMTPEKQADAPEAQAPNPEDFEFGSLDQKYIDAMVDFRTEQAINKRFEQAESQYQERQQQQAAQAEYAKVLDTAKDVVAKGAAQFDDFEEVVWERGLREEYRMDKPTFDAIAEAENGPAIAYALASDPKEAARVADMSPTQQIKYVLQKDAELAKPARAPQAGDPPGRATRGSSGRFTVAGDTDDLEAFEKEFYSKK